MGQVPTLHLRNLNLLVPHRPRFGSQEDLVSRLRMEQKMQSAILLKDYRVGGQGGLVSMLTRVIYVIYLLTKSP